MAISSINTHQLMLPFFFFFFTSFGLSADEPSILLSIKSGIIDPLDHLKNWKLDTATNKANSSAHCSWTGVSCNSQGSVTELDLSHFNLSGKVSEDLGKLSTLASLNLSCNDLSSSLPNSLANLTSLTGIDVSQNSFSGGFPPGLGRIPGLAHLNASGNNLVGALPADLSNATLLNAMDLRGNFFQGSIPASYISLQKLEFLGLSGNNLSGRVPPQLGQLSSLETLIIGYNQFEGGIPPELGNLTSLKYLDLAIANLVGEIPFQMGQLSRLTTLFLYRNGLQGKIPSSMGNLSALVQFDLSDNELSGEIPAEIGELKGLELLNLMCNKLSGRVPPRLGQLPRMQVLELWNNSLSGPLPSDLGRSSPLQWLDVSTNSLSGEIPDGLCNGGNLTKLILFNNRFTGPIPATLTRCSSLVRVRMQSNLLSGSIPVGLAKLDKLQRFEVAKNNLSGEIPDDLSLSPSLSFIDLSQNNLQSSLPSTILSMANLQTFMVANNHLKGEIPDQFQDCPSLSVLDLSSNHFTGSIPASIASCERLVSLNLKNNHLVGQIPDSVAMMPSLAVLDLSNNSLEGTIPTHFGNSPALETFNVSYNNLTGPIPANGILRTINPSDLVGNPGLCGSVLPPCSRSSLDASNSKRLRAKHMITWWLIGISTVLAVGIAGFGSYTLYRRWYSNGCCFEERFEMSSHGEWPWRLMKFQRVSFNSNDILACVKESNVIGMGATGVVYKVEMPRANSAVAVKKLWRSTGDIEKGSGGNSDSEDLIAEVNLLGKLRHRNIVKLLGFLHNNKDAMMIYEYMENGNLGEALHGKQTGKLLVDWVSRYNITLGIAQGLAYLHHDCNPPVIHRDVKSNNILLDANLEARIADFGLARMMIEKNETVSMVAGSYGYIAPEYGYTLKVDEKIDIYSFGVVLLEIVTGKRPLEPEFGESADVVEWVRSKLKNNRPIEEVLDPDLGGDCKIVQEEMTLVLRIALLCTAKLPKDRPSMRDVITMLAEAKPRRKSCSVAGGATADKHKDKPVFSPSPVNGLL